ENNIENVINNQLIDVHRLDKMVYDLKLNSLENDIPLLKKIFGIKLIKEKGYELDYNVSGNRKEYCKEPYIDGYLLDLVKKYDIP
ncbi:hypothetical protein ACTPEM_26300, partial [Clostridioides difficile]